MFKHLKQSSTRTGLLLLAGAIGGLLTGNSELVTVTIGENGAQVGGAIPAVIGLGVGIWDTLRNEKQ
ncbi:hypothetical protein [Thaumasiovibrio subtropicus]|uniref:hypothetical protein n=1 Tax=Thaumasiovibrio subtropicus TaxID=1891207 RepID=UPI000B363EA0|nr:hypothetical protein [Thaumasiovibrio subtropicus]